jgi:hypothetical protein
MKTPRRCGAGTTLVIAAMLFFTGCTTVVRSEAELYFRKHPEERARYSRFSPTDDKSVEDMADALSITRRHWEDTLKRKGEDQQRLEGMARLRKLWYDEDMKLAASLKAAAKKTGGQIYKYQIDKAPRGESGYAIIRNGEIVDRIDVQTWTIHE